MVYDLNGGKSNNDEKLKTGFGTSKILKNNKINFYFKVFGHFRNF